MCGRFVLSDASWRSYWEGLRILPAPPALSWNIAPTRSVCMVVDEDGATEAEARWGLIPPWYRGDLKDFRQTTFNARLETAHEKPSFRAAWAVRRAAIPATGWYEWTGEKGAKQPWFISVDRNTPVFWFAGLWEQRADGLKSCTILTRPADEALRHLHPRMPVVLSDDTVEAWISSGDAEPRPDLGLGHDGRFLFHRVGPVRGDDESLIEPYEEPRDLFG